MRRLLPATAAALLALPLLAATGGASEPSGSASTRMTAVELEIGGLAPIVAVDGRTSATTVGTPLATTDAVALTALGADHAPVRTRSDGRTEDETDTITVGSSDQGVVGVMNPIQARSTAAGDQVVASLAAATTTWVVDLSELAGGLTTRIDSANATSVVTATSATAEQGVAVSNIGLRLGGLVEALDRLPLDTLLGLVDGLGIPLDGDLRTVLATLESAAADVATAADGVTAVGTQTVAQLGDLGTTRDLAGGRVGQVTDLQATYDALGALDPLSPTLGSDILGIMTADELAACGISDLAATLVLDGANAVLAQLRACVADQLQALVADLLADPASFDPATARTDLETVILTLDAAAAQLLAPDGPLGDAIDGLASAIDDLAAVVVATDLQGLVDELVAALDTVGQRSLLSVEELSVDVDAVAGETLAATSATIGCRVQLSVLTTTVGPQTCEGGLAPLLAAAATLNDALDGVGDLLGTLPGVDRAADLAELDLDVLSDATDPGTCPGGAAYVRTCEVDGTTFATAGLRALDLTVPAVTIDPTAAPDVLGDVLDAVAALDPAATIDGVLADIDTALAGSPFAGDADDVLQAAGTAAAGTSGTTLATVDGVLGDVDLGTIGTLVEPVTTPRIDLVLDPVSTASFTPAAPSAPDAPGGPVPAPDPDPTPSLPSTGGGGAFGGLLALAGAYALRRRRD